MKNYIFAITVIVLLFSGPLRNTTMSIIDTEMTNLETTSEAEQSIETNSDSPREGSVGVRVPEWIIIELSESVVSEFIYFECEYKYIAEDGRANIYYLDKDEYSERINKINPVDFALVKELFPEDYTLVNSIEVEENGEIINVAVTDRSFFTTVERVRILDLAYQCALLKCMLGMEESDISITMNYSVPENNEKISHTIPYKANSVVSTTDDMQQVFTIHVPMEYTMGDTELTKQQLIEAGIEDITVNADGTLDYSATKELILKMEDDYYNMLTFFCENIVNQTDYITEIYYSDLRTYIYIEIDTAEINQNDLFSLLDFLSYNNQFLQLFGGVKAEDMQFKITVIDNQNKGVIAELIYPPYGE